MRFSVDSDLRAISLLATAGYYIGIRIGKGGADKVYNAYPALWQQRYAAMSYLLRDPTVGWAYENIGTAHWHELAELDSAGIFADAARHGLAHGVTFAMGPIGARTIASFARDDRAFAADEVKWLRSATTRLHDRTDRDITPRARQALSLIATGKSQALAAHELGISEAAIRARLASARERLGARTTAEAIIMARNLSII
ncbi:helix-turn-helix transcriptional regulator [Paracoccus laeviglucosivorans]|uniref:LuxR family transcriptional regulator n=1 Tax=Paracoccus laeviglucosivorans TaxID=1197861 RepID=A0A521FCF1_9RHOB|nr:autoinducer binding domain-containing protein [Paracoccus laeviglucosivorans]SMO93872.1 LuxR family transcriptional regulator [Paracoccus laeviglucosivorans]